MLVLEGPECTGKTTLANRLMETFNAPMHKMVAIAARFNCMQSVCNDIAQQQLRNLGVGANLVIYDRWQLVSDQIYHPLYNKQPSMFTEMEEVFSNVCIEAGILMVYVDVTLEEMYSRFQGRGDALVDYHTAGVLHTKYQDFFAGTKLPYIHVMTDSKSTEEVMEEIILKAQTFEHTRDVSRQLEHKLILKRLKEDNAKDSTIVEEE